MNRVWSGAALFLGLSLSALLLAPRDARGQIDPEPRRLLQLGFNQPLEGRGPLAGYAFYYWNQPGFKATNLTLRLAVAPTYLDASVGLQGFFGENTDLVVGAAGGGFAESYAEMRGGKYIREESFVGHGAEVSAALFHRFNPGRQIPFVAMVRASVRHATYAGDDLTDSRFVLPPDQQSFNVRAGFRWGGKEPLVAPKAALELSGWYEAQFRADPEQYGFGGDRELEGNTHLFWARALLTYTLPESRHRFEMSVIPGLSKHPDRFSAYRLGGALPLIAEFPLALPGYHFQEITARRFILFSGLYSVPMTASGRWSLATFGSSALVDYFGPFEQPGNWHTGLGGGVTYRSPSEAVTLTVGYAHGFDAIRTAGRGGHSIGFLLQYNLDAGPGARRSLFPPWLNPMKWKGVERMLGR